MSTTKKRKKSSLKKFPNCPVVKTLHFCCRRGMSLIPGRVFFKLFSVAKKKNKQTKN